MELIWTTILTLPVGRRFYSSVVSRAPKEHRGRFPRLRWAKAFAENAAACCVILGS